MLLPHNKKIIGPEEAEGTCGCGGECPGGCRCAAKGAEGRRIAVTGGREFSDEGMVSRVFADIGVNSLDTVVHGGCRGADLLCERVARRQFGAMTEEHKADWKKFGRAAGPIRNREMLRSGIDLLVAFPGGKGTFDCTTTARDMGIETISAVGLDGSPR